MSAGDERILVGAALARAVRTSNVYSVVDLSERLRLRGWRYNEIVAAMTLADPALGAAEYEDVLSLEERSR